MVEERLWMKEMAWPVLRGLSWKVGNNLFLDPEAAIF